MLISTIMGKTELATTRNRADAGRMRLLSCRAGHDAISYETLKGGVVYSHLQSRSFYSHMIPR